jgi:hypothetical protein
MTDPLEFLRREREQKPLGDAKNLEHLLAEINDRLYDLATLYADLGRKFEHLTTAFALLVGEREREREDA